MKATLSLLNQFLLSVHDMAPYFDWCHMGKKIVTQVEITPNTRLQERLQCIHTITN